MSNKEVKKLLDNETTETIDKDGQYYYELVSNEKIRNNLKTLAVDTTKDMFIKVYRENVKLNNDDHDIDYASFLSFAHCKELNQNQTKNDNNQGLLFSYFGEVFDKGESNLFKTLGFNDDFLKLVLEGKDYFRHFDSNNKRKPSRSHTQMNRNNSIDMSQVRCRFYATSPIKDIKKIDLTQIDLKKHYGVINQINGELLELQKEFGISTEETPVHRYNTIYHKLEQILFGEEAKYKSYDKRNNRESLRKLLKGREPSRKEGGIAIKPAPMDWQWCSDKSLAFGEAKNPSVFLQLIKAFKKKDQFNPTRVAADMLIQLATLLAVVGYGIGVVDCGIGFSLCLLTLDKDKDMYKHLEICAEAELLVVEAKQPKASRKRPIISNNMPNQEIKTSKTHKKIKVPQSSIKTLNITSSTKIKPVENNKTYKYCFHVFAPYFSENIGNYQTNNTKLKNDFWGHVVHSKSLFDVRHGLLNFCKENCSKQQFHFSPSVTSIQVLIKDGDNKDDNKEDGNNKDGNDKGNNKDDNNKDGSNKDGTNRDKNNKNILNCSTYPQNIMYFHSLDPSNDFPLDILVINYMDYKKGLNGAFSVHSISNEKYFIKFKTFNEKNLKKMRKEYYNCVKASKLFSNDIIFVPKHFLILFHHENVKYVGILSEDGGEDIRNRDDKDNIIMYLETELLNHNIVHLDLRPENVVYDENKGKYGIIDWECASL